MQGWAVLARRADPSEAEDVSRVLGWRCVWHPLEQDAWAIRLAVAILSFLSPSCDLAVEVTWVDPERDLCG